MSRFWNPRIHQLRPYIPGEQPCIGNLVKLNTNESPYGPSPMALQAIAQQVQGKNSDDLRLYPDPTASVLRSAIADFHHFSPEQVFAGNGSDEVLAHAFRALFQEEAPVLFADISYGFYPVYCRLFGLNYREIALREDFRLDVADYFPDRAGPTGGIIIANPNANTGMALTTDHIEALLRARPDCVVVIDEAYVDFGAETASGLIAHYENLLVIRTFSKSSGLAGLRVGYALGSPALIEGLVRVKDSFNSYPLSRLALAGAAASLRDIEWMEATTRKIARSRAWLVAELTGLGFHILPSSANFILVHHPAHKADTLFSALRDRAVLVRHLAGIPRISDWLRITIGTDAECRKLVDALNACCQFS